MKKAKKTVSLILAMVMILGIIVIAPTTVSAAGGVQAKIDTVRSVYPNSCKYFTRSGNQCTNASGEDCKLQNIPARGGLPSGASVSSWGCYSCYAFAEYVFAYTFGKSFRNFPTAAKPVFGDVIRVVGWYGESHYGIYLGEDANYYYVFDGNGDGKCGVQYNHALSKSEHPLQQTYHASNYNDIDGEPAGNNPEGTLDIVSSDKPGRIFIRGWAFDRDNLNDTLSIHVYIGKQEPNLDPNCELHTIVANTERSDLDDMFHVGKNHGFCAYIDTSLTGDYNVYVYAINIGSGSNAIIGQKAVTIQTPYSPEGTIDIVTANVTGKVFVRGWAFDRDDLEQSISIHVYIGQQEPNKDSNCEFHAIKADFERTDLDDMFHVGKNHGFSSYIDTQKTGSQNVYVYAINIGGGGNTFIGSRSVTITPATETQSTQITESATDKPTQPTITETVVTSPTVPATAPITTNPTESKPTETTPTTEPTTKPTETTVTEPTEAPTLPNEGIFHVVAGSPELCNGVEWDPASPLNLMTLGDDGVYRITYSNVPAGTYEFKVTTNGAWDNGEFNLVGNAMYGGSNAEITVTEDNSTVLISFKESDMHANAYINGVLVDVGATEPTEPMETQPTTVKPTEPTDPTQAPKTDVKEAKYNSLLYVKGYTYIKPNIINPKGKTTFKSDNPNIARVYPNGKVVALRKGIAWITVENNNAGKVFMVEVRNPSLNKTSLTLYRGQSTTLKIKGKIGKARFYSSNTSVAKVNKSGKITARKKGKAKITVLANGVTLKCKVKVK